MAGAEKMSPSHRLGSMAHLCSIKTAVRLAMTTTARLRILTSRGTVSLHVLAAVPNSLPKWGGGVWDSYVQKVNHPSRNYIDGNMGDLKDSRCYYE